MLCRGLHRSRFLLPNDGTNTNSLFFLIFLFVINAPSPDTYINSLISNIGYLSESAASLIDTRLGPLGIVPPTAVVQLNSPTFQYVEHDRRTPLPDKVGSFQCFLDGFADATVFFREYPWPEEGRGWRCFGEEEEGEEEERGEGFRWTPGLRRQFKEEFEKMVVLDYLIRNTGEL